MSGERVGKVLAQVSRAACLAGIGLRGATQEERVREVLEERLGPLLRAGQAMRDEVSGGIGDGGYEELRSMIHHEPVVAWDAALAALDREPTT